ncbi:MAG: repeat containing protein [Acidobacteriaceae bacterium]|nr:repeat containing protein [Acidobacteriaceae bacterium]
MLALGAMTSASAQGTVHFPALAAGVTTSASQQVTVTATTGGTISGIKVLTQGAPNADFRDIGGGTCALAIGQTYFAGQSCTVNVVMQPTYPGTHTGAVILQGAAGSLGTQFVDGLSHGPLALIVPGVITTVAGTGAWIYRQDGVPAYDAPIFLPMGVAVDAAGNLFLSDSNNNRVRRVDGASGLISTVAGTGDPGFAGDGSLATSAKVSAPSALALDGAGNLYFADTGNNVIRRIDGITGIITTVAGTGTQQGYTGDNGPAIAAKLNQPYGLTFDANQNLYIADTGNNVLRKVVLASGTITTVAGTGVPAYLGDGGPAVAAQLNTPWGLSFTPDGSIYIADLNNNVIRRISSSNIITTVVGTGTRGFSGDKGAASTALLNSPAAVTVDVAGNIYVADSGNNRVRKVNISSGIITTIAGTVGDSNAGDGGVSTGASLYGPYALLLDGPGNLYISDMFHNRVKRISSNAVSLFYPDMRVNRISTTIYPEALENDGNADLSLTTLSLDSNSALDAATTTCFSGAVVTSANTCTLGVEFAPTTVGSPISGSITLRTDAANSPGVIKLSGTVLSVDPTSVTLTSSLNPAGFGTPITLTALVSTTGTSVTGTMKFLDGTALIGTATLDATGSASTTLSTLALGSHTITAVYSGDATNAASTSTALVQVVRQPTTLALVSSTNPSTVSAPVTFTATLSGGIISPVGNVTFSDGTTMLQRISLTTAGTASMTLATLTPGAHTITALYSGDTNNMTSQTVLTQTVAQASTLTTVPTSSNPSVTVGTTITFSSTVTSIGGPLPTGSVTFKDGATILGAGNLDPAGNATFSTSTLAPGSHPITATYAGDTNSVASTSTALNQTVVQVGTSTVLVPNPNPANAGATLTLTATVSAAGGSTAGGILSGRITFQDGATPIGSADIAPNGVATLSIKTLTVGAHMLTAVYSGNTNYATSTSTGFTETVQQSTTTTTLASSSNPAIAGKSVTLTATVVSVGGIPTGTVTFRDGTIPLGQPVQLNAQGVATLSTTSLNVANHTIVATYNADANNSTSDSAPFAQNIQIATTSLQLAGSSNPAVVGVAVTFTATLSGNGGQPTGSIVFSDGATVLGSRPINGAAPVSFTLSILAVGSHPVTASYAGDAGNSGSNSTTINQEIQQAATTISLLPSQSPTQLGQAVTFTSAVSNPSTTIVATGSVTFQEGSTVLGTAALNGAGSTTFTTSTLSLGKHTITATYSGDANHVASTSTAIVQQVLQATAITLTSNGTPSIAGKNVIFTANLPGIPGTVPTGSVTFKDGTTVLGVGTLDGSGSAFFSTTALPLGLHSITALYSGDNNFQTVTSGVFNQAVQIAQTNIVLTSSANPAVYGAPLSFSASITGTGGPITGTVTFQDGTAVIGSATLNAGVAVFTISTLSPAGHPISALYSGDSNNSPNISAVLQQQVRQVTKTVLASSANPALTLDPITLTASITNAGAAAATGSVTFTEGASVLGTVALDTNGNAALTIPSLAAGQHLIVATYAGDVANIPSASTAFAQVVNLRPTTTVLTATSTSVADTQQVTLISVVRFNGPTPPTGTITFLNGTKVLGASPVDKTGVAALTIIINTLTANLTASYSGDINYTPSASAVTPITSGPPTQFTLDISNSAVQLKSKEHVTVNVVLSSIKGFSDTLVLGCLGLPYAATCTFSSDQLKLAGDTAQTIKLVIDTGSPLTSGSVGAGTASVQTKSSSTVALSFLPIGAILGIFLYRGRRRVSIGGLLLVLCLLGSLGITGCGSIDINGTPAGTYTFKITAAGVGSGATQYKDITLTVVQ